MGFGMIRQYGKQAIGMLKENRLISMISIIGTAVAIAMIMVVVFVLQIQWVNYYPEYHRDRTLQVQALRVSYENGNVSGGSLALEPVREIFYPLRSVEAVTAIAYTDRTLSLQGRRSNKTYRVKYVDDGFWKVFGFRFLEGKPFSGEEFQSGVRRVVLSDRVARRLFGSDEAVGKEILVDVTPYTVCGVVENVSKVANTAYAEAWVPYTCESELRTSSFHEHTLGNFSVCLLAPAAGDFPVIRQEIAHRLAAYQATKKEVKVEFLDHIYTRFDLAIGSAGLDRVELRDFLPETGCLLLFLLLVPALNLLGVTRSSVLKRRAEMGVRKAFGATRGTLMTQILSENLVLTLIGSLVGLLLSFLFLYIGKSFMLSDPDAALSGEMLFQPMVFLAAFFCCLLLNVLSAGLPTWFIVRQPIGESLKDHEER